MLLQTNLGISMFRSMDTSTRGHPAVPKFHKLCSTIMKSNNGSTPRLPQKLNASTGSVNVKLYQQPGSVIL